MPSSYTLGAHFEGFVKEQVQSGRYSTASEVMRDALRLLQEKEATQAAKLDALKRAIHVGTESGEAVEAYVVFEQLEAKYGKAF